MSVAKDIIRKLVKVDNIKPQKVSPSYLELVEFFTLTPISSKRQHRSALKIAEEIIIFLNTQERDNGLEMYLETLALLISKFEDKMYPSLEN